MIDLAMEPPAVAAAVSRVVTMRFANAGPDPLSNLVVSLDVPAGLGLEQGRSQFHLERLGPGSLYEHVLRIRPPRPGDFTIDVRNLSFRNGYGAPRRERNRSVDLVVEPAEESLAPTLRASGPPPAAAVPTSIFVSYRREDTELMVAGLARDLGRPKRLRRVNVFLDIRDIRPGTEWSIVLDEELRACSLLVAVIGPKWAERGPDGRAARIHDSHDVVRREIATALERGIPILPLLVKSTMPCAADLPGEIRGLTRWQAFPFDIRNYDSSVEQLARRIRAILADRAASL